VNSTVCTKRITSVELKSICLSYGVKVQGQFSNEIMRCKLLQALESGINSVDSSNEMNILFPSFNHTNGGCIFSLCEQGII
jgi:hypothetical protein